MTTDDTSSRLKRKRALERHFADDFGTLAYPLLANAYYQEGDMVRARKVCRIGLKHHPDHAPGLFLMALVDMREGRMEEAEQLLDRTLAQDPYHVEAAEYLVAIQERLKRPQGILERAYKILLLANPLSHSARARLKRMQAEKELVLKVKREMRLRESAARDPAKVGGSESVGELQPLLAVELPAKDTGAAESEQAPFVPTARLTEEPPVDILLDEEAERVERIEARLEESDQLTEAERSWERHIKDVATELAQTQQVPEAVPGPQSTSFPLEDYGAGESEPAITTAAPEAELPAEQATPEAEGTAAVPVTDTEETLDAAAAKKTVIAEETAVEKAAETADDRPWPGEEAEGVELEPWPGKEEAKEPTGDITPVQEAGSTEPAADSEEAVTTTPVEESLIAAEPAAKGTSEPLDERPWPGDEEGGADDLEPWPEPTAMADTAGESTGADSADITLEDTPAVVEEPALEAESETAPEEEIVAALESPEAAAMEELTPDFFEDQPPVEGAETVKSALEGGQEEEDTWATYLKPENVLGDDALTVEAEVSAEGEAPSVAAELDDLERELTTERDAGESEPMTVEPEPGAEPEIEPPSEPEQPIVPADEGPPGLSISARLAQLREELSTKYAPEEPAPPAPKKAKAKSKPKAQVTAPSPGAPGDEAGGDTQTEPVAEVEAKIEAAEVPMEVEVSPPGTTEEAGEPPADKPLPITGRLSRPGKEIAQDDTSAPVAGPELEANVPEIESEAGPVEDTSAPADDAIATPPAGPGGPEPEAEMAAAADDQLAPREPTEVAEVPSGAQSPGESIIEEDPSPGEGQPSEDAPPPPAERFGDPTDPAVASFVDPMLATFTLVKIYQVQGLYRQALEALDILEKKGGDPERIKRERATITAAMSSGSKSD